MRLNQAIILSLIYETVNATTFTGALIGDIIALDMNSDTERYIKATEKDIVVNVHSDTYGHIIGVDNPPNEYKGSYEDYNDINYIPSIL